MRVVDRVRATLPRVFYRGRDVRCPICEGQFRAFMPFNARPDAKCPGCGSLERHRLLWVYLQELDVEGDILHVSPEAAIAARLERLPGVRYLSVDLEPGAAMVEGDVTALPFADESFDLLVCLHVLEHVPNDRAAMREFHRVLRPGGKAILQHPVDMDTLTYEDWTITTPQARAVAFGQRDHVRRYGHDLIDRLSEAGFEVRLDRPTETIAPDRLRSEGLTQRTTREPVFCFCSAA